MLLIDYLSIGGEDLPDYTKQATWKLFHAYTDAHFQILIDEYIVDGVQAISRLKPQCENTTFSN